MQKIKKALSLKNTLVMACVLLFAYVVVLLLASFYVVPFQDDFFVRSDRFEAYDVWLREVTLINGRASALLLSAVLSSLSLWWVPGIVSISVLAFGIYWLSYEIFSSQKVSAPKAGIAAASAGLFITTAAVLMMQNPFSDIYWLSASIVHAWSWGIVLILTAYLLRTGAKAQPILLKKVAIVVAIAVPLPLFNELATLLLLGTAALCVIGTFVYPNHLPENLRRMGLALLIATSSAMVIMRLSPGALSRVSLESSQMSFVDALMKTPQFAIQYWTDSLMNGSLLLVAVGFGVLVGLYALSKKKLNRELWMKTAVSVAAVGCIFLIIFAVNIFVVLYSLPWASTGFFPERTQTFTVLALVASAFSVGVFLSRPIKATKFENAATVLTTLVLVGIYLSHLGYAQQLVSIHEDLRERNKAYSARESTIESSNSCPVAVQSTTVVGIQEGADLTTDPQHWINDGVESYYDKEGCGIIEK